MCGIFGAVSQRNVTEVLLNGLQRLEYRGYDSAGLAVINTKGNLVRLRCCGKVKTLNIAAKKHCIKGKIGIAHTRWATHGKPSKNNAHPHMSEHIAVVHNGIIENYESLRSIVQLRGYTLITETDTEVIAHLIHWELSKNGVLIEAVLRTIQQLNGSYSIVVMDSNNPNMLLATCFGSPIVIGLGIKENFIASDQVALMPITNRFLFLQEGDVSEITQSSVKIFNKDGLRVIRHKIISNFQYKTNSKKTFRHYMKKEIYEQPDVIKNTIDEHIKCGKIILNELNAKYQKILTKIDHIQIVACGTSYNSGMVSRYWFEELAGISCDVEIASEFRYRKFVVRHNSIMITISQSGETADTLAALRLSKRKSYLASLAICNVPWSSLVRESDVSLITKAGMEISVASTKTFTTQLTMLLMLAIKISQLKGQDVSVAHNIVFALQSLSNNIEQIFLKENQIKQIAKDFSKKHHVLFLGRGNQYPIAIEGALKLKEISYIHAEAYAAGELKHGPLALVDKNMPVIVTAPKNNLVEKLKSNIEEVRSRGGQLYVFADQNVGFSNDSNMTVIEMPHVEDTIAPIFYIIPLQLLAYHIALIKGKNIDKPRNLAKSVTVE